MTSSSLGASAPAVFDFHAHQVRVVLKDGEPWFVAKDVCDTLGYANSRKAVGDHLDDDEKGVTSSDTLGGQQKLAIISESGLYALVLRSRKPEARKFAKWVTAEVLPAIRKTGGYSASGDMVSKAHALRCLQLAGAAFAEAQRAVTADLLDMDEFTVKHSRVLVTMDWSGQIATAKPVPDDAAVMSPAQLLRALTEGNGIPVPTADLAQFIQAAAAMLARRCTHYEATAAKRSAA